LVAVKDFFLRCNLLMITGEPEQPRKFGLFIFNFTCMIIVVKSGQRQTLQVTCKKVVIKITDYKLRCKRSKSLKIKAKGEQPQISQARL
jgi:hypothetical protein